MFHKNRNLQLSRWIALSVFLFSITFLTQVSNTNFQANVLSSKQAKPFDGLVAPIQKVPNWLALNSSQWKQEYNAISSTISLPVYDPAQLKLPNEQLGWKSDSDKQIRNAKITYSTPYMSGYRLDGTEHTGSHLAVDIKIPVGTPVFVIGNGIVTKVAYLSSGFGKHVVVKHVDFPSFDNPSIKTTYYSSYNHLSEIQVQEGDVVTKGQQIALSGNSGIATTPHLHFQIDNDKASFHPYWPFTYKEVADAGLDFTSGINAGFGREKALAATINPMLYVQKYQNGTQVPALTPAAEDVSQVVPAPLVEKGETSSDINKGGVPIGDVPVIVNPAPVLHATPSSQEVSTVEVTNIPEVVSDPTVVETPGISVLPVAPAKPAVALKIVTDDTFVVGVEKKLLIQAVDDEGNVTSAYQPSDIVNLKVENGGASLKKSYLLASDFHDGSAEAFVVPTATYGLRVSANDGTFSAESEVLKSNVFTDIASNGDILESVQFLKNYHVIEGYADGSFRPDAVVSRVEALKFIIKGLNIPTEKVQKLPFKDTKVSEWYGDFVSTGYSQGIIAGYSDQTFRPAQTVNRVEFWKMLLSAMKISSDTPLPAGIFTDVSNESWYSKFIAAAYERNLIPTVSGNVLKPEGGMTRGEVAQIMRRVIVLKAGELEKYDKTVALSDGQLTKFLGL